MTMQTIDISPKTTAPAIIVAFVLATWGASDCHGQVRRYQPATPTVSPYTNLTRFNEFGGLPNYYSLVRPQLQQEAFNRQAMAIRRQYAGSLQRLSNEVQQGLQPAAPTGSGSWFMVPPAESGYLTSSRYYSTPGGFGGASRLSIRPPATARPVSGSAVGNPASRFNTPIAPTTPSAPGANY